MFDWASYLALAQTLAKSSDEASRRSAVSRAYYAVFNKARRMLEVEGTVIPDTGRAHDDVWRTLEGAGKGRRRLGIDGKRLRELRRKADYVAEVPALDKVTQDALATAETLNRLVDAEAASKTGK
jgi:uncharacterized protein (UPF0332 family)